MRFYFLKSPIPLFDLCQEHSSVPTKFRKAAARSCGQGRPLGRRECALSLTAAGTAARCRSTGTMPFVVLAVAIATSVIVPEVSCEPLSKTSSSAGEHVDVGDHLDSFIAEASERFGIPAAWIRAIIRVGSAGDARISSRNGAIGLMQVMPETWMELRLRYAFGTDPSDPRDNILAGAAHLRETYDRYGSKGFLAAYLTSPTRYDEHLKTGVPLPAETQAFVAVLAPLIEPGLKDVVSSNVRGTVISWRKAPLFVAQTERSSSDAPLTPGVPAERPSKHQSAADRPALAPRSDGLFVRRGMEAQPQ